MKTRNVLILIVIVALIVYLVFIKPPKITIVSIDKQAKRANINIGDRAFTYIFDKNVGLQIPLKYGFSASIKPGSDAKVMHTTGDPYALGAVLVDTPVNYSIIELYRGSSLVRSQIIDFS